MVVGRTAMQGGRRAGRCSVLSGPAALLHSDLSHRSLPGLKNPLTQIDVRPGFEVACGPEVFPTHGPKQNGRTAQKASSSAALTPTRNRAAASTPSSITRETTALPITTPSAARHASTACSGVDTPIPTRTGRSVAARHRRTTSAERSDNDERTPVTPSVETAYTNPVHVAAIA